MDKSAPPFPPGTLEFLHVPSCSSTWLDSSHPGLIQPLASPFLAALMPLIISASLLWETSPTSLYQPSKTNGSTFFLKNPFPVTQLGLLWPRKTGDISFSTKDPAFPPISQEACVIEAAWGGLRGLAVINCLESKG